MNNKGFTLTEIMAVLLIMIVLVAVALPFYSNVVYRQNNARAKALLESINGGIERFHREYPNVAIPAATILTPADGIVCNYHGQQVTQMDGATALAQTRAFVNQLIVCGYLPRYNYGTMSGNTYYTANDGSLDYVYHLRPRPAHGTSSDNVRCGYGYVYMDPKIFNPNDNDPNYTVGRQFCTPYSYSETVQSENNEPVTTNYTYCDYCAGIDENGKSANYLKSGGQYE